MYISSIRCCYSTICLHIKVFWIQQEVYCRVGGFSFWSDESTWFTWLPVIGLWGRDGQARFYVCQCRKVPGVRSTSCFSPNLKITIFEDAALCTNTTDAVWNGATFHTDTTFERQQSTGQVLRIALAWAMNRNLYCRWATGDIGWCHAEWCWCLSHVLCHLVGLFTAFVSHSTWEVSCQTGRIYCVKIMCKEVSAI